MAPEVIQQSGYDFKADIWSLGITAIELIHGEPPNAGKHPMKVLMEIPKMPAPRLEGSQYSKDLKDFVAKCLIKDPDLRPSAKKLLEHRFIRGAGRTEALQELILRRQEWEAGLAKKETLKYYAETLRNVRLPVQEDEDDDWLFDTVKAAPAIQQHTQKRRKVSAVKVEEDVREDDMREMMEDTELSPGSDQQRQIQHSTMRRVPDLPLPASSSPSVRRTSTKKRISSGQQKQPLGVNMSFGNSPSTVRQFRRVSPTAIENDKSIAKDVTNTSSTNSSLSPSKLRTQTQTPLPSDTDREAENMPPPPLPSRTSTCATSSTGTTTSSSLQSQTSTTPSSVIPPSSSSTK
jgi:serine/threonine-protein kinase 24/25/MST4